MTAVLWHWFDFPGGGVLQNLVASGFAFVAGLLVGRAWSKRLHAKIDTVHQHVLDLHEKLDAHPSRS